MYKNKKISFALQETDDHTDKIINKQDQVITKIANQSHSFIANRPE
jgi:hypothetical protein